MLVTNLKHIHSNTHETIIHYDDSMLRDKFIFEESTVFTDNKDIITTINIKHYNSSDAFHFTLYEGFVLAPIEVLRILSDTVNLYRDNSLNSFLKLMGELSVSTMTSLSQSQEKNKREIREWIMSSFKQI